MATYKDHLRGDYIRLQRLLHMKHDEKFEPLEHLSNNPYSRIITS